MKKKHKTKRKRKDKPKSSEETLSRHKQDGRPILLTRISLRILFRLPKPLNRICTLYYSFLLVLCAERMTNRVWCNDDYAAEGLNCSPGLIEKAKAELVKLSFIKIEQTHNKDGSFGKSYIVCKYYARRSMIDEALKFCNLPKLDGNFRSNEVKLVEIMEKIKNGMNAELEDLQRKATKLCSKSVRRERHNKQKKSSVTTKNVVTSKKKQSPGLRKSVTREKRDAVKRGTNTYRAKEKKNNYITKGLDKSSEFFIELINMFDKRFKKSNRKMDNETMEDRISSLKELNNDGIKKGLIEEVMEDYLNPENRGIPDMPKVHSIKDFCKHFIRIRHLLEISDD